MSWSEIASVIGVTLSVLALAWQVHSLRASYDRADYTELDKLYLEILRLRVDRPELVPAPQGEGGVSRFGSGSAADPVACDAYAFIVWNFIETIIDRCERPGRNFTTWGPVVAYESRLYGYWFEGANRLRFKPGLQLRVQRVIGLVDEERERQTRLAAPR